MEDGEQTFYEILGLPPTASQLDIKKAYRKLALIYHPDRRNVVASNKDTNNGTPDDTKEMFQKIGEAYHCLSDPARKRQYDREIEHNKKWSSMSSSGKNNHNSDTTTNERNHARYKPPSCYPYPSRPSFASSVLLSELIRGRQGQQHEGRDSSSSSSSRFFQFALEDAFEQFDSLFHQDPFFQEYGFREMDEEFARRFYDNNNDSDDVEPAMAACDEKESQRTSNQIHQGSDASDDQEKSGWMPSWLQKVIESVQPNQMSDSKKSPSTTSDPQATTISKNTDGWIPWILRQICGVHCEFQMTTIASNGRGGVTKTTKYYSSPSQYSQLTQTDPKTSWHVPDYNSSRSNHGHCRQQQRRGRIVPSSSPSSTTRRPTQFTYTRMSTSSYIDREGRHVTIQSKEVDGNRIEDRRINNSLVRRKINGVTVDV